MNALYDKIGLDYANLRQPDDRIATLIERALGQAETILNVGAGAGSYEPTGRQVTAVEPSAEMTQQRANSVAKVVQACAEHLPFDDNFFDAAMAILTIHHWSDQKKGVLEMARVTNGKIIFLTYDPAFRGFWLADYFPDLITLDEGQMPHMSDYEKWLGPVNIAPVPIPHDCTDGFLAGYWRRPAAYLDARIRNAMSPFWALGDVSGGLNELTQDLQSGAWAQRYSHLIDLPELDCGYRLVSKR